MNAQAARASRAEIRKAFGPVAVATIEQQAARLREMGFAYQDLDTRLTQRDADGARVAEAIARQIAELRAEVCSWRAAMGNTTWRQRLRWLVVGR